MAYDETLAKRIRRLLVREKGVTEKRMFGGLAFMLQSRMLCGIVKDELMVRVGPERYEKVLARPHARPMDFTGRPLKGFVFIEPNGCKSDRELRQWLDEAVGFAKARSPTKRRPAPGRSPAPDARVAPQPAKRLRRRSPGSRRGGYRRTANHHWKSFLTVGVRRVRLYASAAFLMTSACVG